jgi:2-C-methyl-D-erythritol 4-phosphate cytidylyltransferase / 2-C-methyl-D-erythritol 2,4-cyclodiphosphate synthase
MPTAQDDPRATCYALVPCAGTGIRAGADGPKQYIAIAGRSVVARTLATLHGVPRLAATLVVLAPGDDRFESAAPDFRGPRAWVARCGGASRAASVAAGLDALAARGAQAHDWVLVHDAARCLLRTPAVERLIDACADDAVGGLLAVPLVDTLKQAGAGERVAVTLDRRGKWIAQTPQMFRLGLLRQALASADDDVTDEAGAIEALGHAPLLVRGEPDNFKLTWPADFALAERLLMAAGDTPPGVAAREPDVQGSHMSMRIGEGWDTHELVLGRPLVLGGVTIAHSHGLAGHSDADALAHAITDALLGAAALGDIGRHFPDTDPAFEGADSMRLLAQAALRVRAAGYQIGNVDGTIIAQAPKLAPHIDAMRSRLAEALGLSMGQVNVKAKTAEKMGPVGEGRAIEARAVCLLLTR